MHAFNHSGFTRSDLGAPVSEESTHVEIVPVSQVTASVQIVDQKTFDKKISAAPWYKKWWVYAVGGGVVVVGGGGTIWALRRGKRRGK